MQTSDIFRTFSACEDKSGTDYHSMGTLPPKIHEGRVLRTRRVEGFQK